MRISPEIADSIELRFGNLARRMNAKGADIVSLGLGEPDFPTPPEIIEAAVRAMKDGYTRYSDPLGLSELRESISEKLKSENGIMAGPDRIVVTPGAKMALSLALGAILEPGDEVINITPCYPSYMPQIRIAEAQATIRTIDLRRQDFGLDLDRIAENLGPRTKAILFNSPHNPTGWMISENEADALVALFRNHSCYVITDEIYEKLNFSGRRHVSLGAFPEIADRVVTVNGFSKAYSMTGWRIGYLAAPKRLMRGISRLQQHLNTNTAPFIQKAAMAAFALSNTHIENYNSRLCANADCLANSVASNSGLSVIPSAGGLFAFLNISFTGLDSDSFATQLLETAGVALTPGIVFGCRWDDHVRISLAIATDRFKEGIARLRMFTERHI